MAQNFSYRPLTAEDFQCNASPCKVCGGPIGTVRGFLPFPRCNRLTCTVTALLSGGQGLGLWLGNLQTNCGIARFHCCPSLRLPVVTREALDTKQLANCFHFQLAPTDMYATCQANETLICSRTAVSSHSELTPKCSVCTDIRISTRKMEPLPERTVPHPTPLYALHVGASGRQRNCDAASPGG